MKEIDFKELVKRALNDAKEAVKKDMLGMYRSPTNIVVTSPNHDVTDVEAVEFVVMARTTKGEIQHIEGSPDFINTAAIRLMNMALKGENKRMERDSRPRKEQPQQDPSCEKCPVAEMRPQGAEKPTSKPTGTTMTDPIVDKTKIN